MRSNEIISLKKSELGFVELTLILCLICWAIKIYNLVHNKIIYSHGELAILELHRSQRLDVLLFLIAYIVITIVTIFLFFRISFFSFFLYFLVNVPVIIIGLINFFFDHALNRLDAIICLLILTTTIGVLKSKPPFLIRNEQGFLSFRNLALLSILILIEFVLALFLINL